MDTWINQVICGDCLEVMRELPDNSIDAVVTDPPYELGFMGKKWDSTGIAYNVELWQECLRVLKPGGHLLSFGGTRTYHRMACAIEDAGFEIRDCIQWLYSMGFPKSHDISKAIDKKLGAERKIVGLKPYTNDGSIRGNSYNKGSYERVQLPITAPATPEAQEWEGWGTALKPANEPIVLARKPLSEKTIAENVLKWGTGGINIDDCRVEYDMTDTNPATNPLYRKENGYKTNYGIDSNPSAYALKKEEGTMNINNQGRFPANIIFDEEAGRLLDEQSGVSKSKKSMRGVGYTDSNVYGVGDKDFDTERGFNDSGGASRFFYCAKASKTERAGSKHPTVKPLKLMRYLVRLITPPNGIVLDPFTGSGTTLEASLLEGFSFVGIEKQAEHIPDIEARIERGHETLKEEIEQAQAQQSLFGGDAL